MTYIYDWRSTLKLTQYSASKNFIHNLRWDFLPYFLISWSEFPDLLLSPWPLWIKKTKLYSNRTYRIYKKKLVGKKQGASQSQKYINKRLLPLELLSFFLMNSSEPRYMQQQYLMLKPSLKWNEQEEMAYLPVDGPQLETFHYICLSSSFPQQFRVLSIYKDRRQK